MRDFTKDELLVELLVPVCERAIIKAAEKLANEKKDNDEDIATISWVQEVTGLARQTIYQNLAIPRWREGNKLYFSKKAVRAWLTQKAS